mmetsp:Transcript_32698/g.98742  ORF Transcript_32698/g.98742 Transcript_32698/m.98742 type:complete len:303 (+) Transcript_32698:292-1200(+)
MLFHGTHSRRWTSVATRGFHVSWPRLTPASLDVNALSHCAQPQLIAGCSAQVARSARRCAHRCPRTRAQALAAVGPSCSMQRSAHQCGPLQVPGQGGIREVDGSPYGVGVYAARSPAVAARYIRGQRALFVCAGLVGPTFTTPVRDIGECGTPPTPVASPSHAAPMIDDTVMPRTVVPSRRGRHWRVCAEFVDSAPPRRPRPPGPWSLKTTARSCQSRSCGTRTVTRCRAGALNPTAGACVVPKHQGKAAAPRGAGGGVTEVRTRLLWHGAYGSLPLHPCRFTIDVRPDTAAWVAAEDPVVA